MRMRLQLAVVVTAVCAWVVVGTVRASAQAGYDGYAAAMIAMGEMMDRALSLPSLGGPTGIVSLPNAYCPGIRSRWQVVLNYQGMRALSLGMYQARADLGMWTLQAAGRVSDRTEVWGAYGSATDHDRSRVWGLGGKSILTHREKWPSVAVGASYHGWGNAFPAGSWTGGNSGLDANVLKGYAVVTGVLGGEEWIPLLGTAGVVHIRLDPDYGSSRSLTRPFLGVQAVWWGTALGLEYRWPDRTLDTKPVFSAAIRQVLSDEVMAEVGTTNASPVGTGLSAQRLFLRLSHAL